MKKTYTAVIARTDPWSKGWVEGVPGVNCQQAIKHDLLKTLRIAFRDAVDFCRQEEATAERT